MSTNKNRQSILAGPEPRINNIFSVINKIIRDLSIFMCIFVEGEFTNTIYQFSLLKLLYQMFGLKLSLLKDLILQFRSFRLVVAENSLIEMRCATNKVQIRLKC